MFGLIYHGKRDLRYERLEEPGLVDDRDILVGMKACGICGSDLHIYSGSLGEIPLGSSAFCIGHEAVGEVLDVARGVTGLRPGDEVMIAPLTGCGACRWCALGEVKKCEKRPQVFGVGGGLGGCQAEIIRVPAGDFNTAKVPEGLDLDQALLLTDNLPTAYGAVVNAEIQPGRSVAVVGLGPIGLMAVELSLMMGASVVYAIDPIEDRRAAAQALGATPLFSDDLPAEIQDATHGEMIDCVIEAAGSDRAMELALSLVGIRGNVSVLGVNPTMNFRMPFQAFANGITVRGNFITEVSKYWPALVPLLRQGKIRPERLITDRHKLADGAAAYEAFSARDKGALKAIMLP